MADKSRPHEALIDRRIRKIVNARSVTAGLAATFVIMSFVCAIVIWLVDRHDFPTLGLAVWWSLQTVTTVGYGDVVPTTDVGRVIGGAELVFGVSFIAFLTAGVTSTVIERARGGTDAVQSAAREREAQAILDALGETKAAMAALDSRLDLIESKLTS
jgi:voltage-gated potassium channel